MNHTDPLDPESPIKVQENNLQTQESEIATPPPETAEVCDDKMPPGLKNYWRACYANSSFQCLLGVPEFIDQYESSFLPIVHDARNLMNSFGNIDRKANTKCLKSEREAVRAEFKKNEDML